jgi:general secretion pathway protein G
MSHKLKRQLILSQRGFTLVEIMIVLAILGSLAAVLGTTVMGALDKSKVKEAQIQIKEVSKALEIYNADCGTYPTTDQGLKALVQSPGADACPNWGPNSYLKNEPKDPWNGNYVYESDGGTFHLKSYGKDHKEGGDGFAKDISSDD